MIATGKKFTYDVGFGGGDMRESGPIYREMIKGTIEKPVVRLSTDRYQVGRAYTFEHAGRRWSDKRAVRIEDGFAVFELGDADKYK